MGRRLSAGEGDEMVRFGLLILAIAATACSGSPAAQGPSATPTASPTPTTKAALWRPATAPTGAPSGSDWIAVDTFDGKTLIAAVQRPVQTAASPIVVMLHPDGGLRGPFLTLASSVAKAGFLTVTPCWAQAVDINDPPVGCSSGAPARFTAADLTKDVMAIADAARTLPGASPDRAALVGHSGGAQAAFIVGSIGKVDAVVAISAGYGPAIRQRWGTTLPDQLDRLGVPLLMVHGTEDMQGPGTQIDLVRAFEKTARDKGKTVEAIYVEGGPHLLPYTPQYWTDEVQGKVIAFLKKHLA